MSKYIVQHGHVGTWPRGTKLTEKDLKDNGLNPDDYVRLGAIAPLNGNDEVMSGPIASSHTDPNLPSAIVSPNDRADNAGIEPGQDAERVAQVVADVQARRAQGNTGGGEVNTERVIKALETQFGEMLNRQDDEIHELREKVTRLEGQIATMNAAPGADLPIPHEVKAVDLSANPGANPQGGTPNPSEGSTSDSGNTGTPGTAAPDSGNGTVQDPGAGATGSTTGSTTGAPKPPKTPR